jgi:hypothetical protein
VLVAATNGTALVGWILVVVGAMLFLIGAAISVIVALRKQPPTDVTAAGPGAPPIGTIIGWIFKYGGAGAPVMAIGFLLVAIGLSILGYKIFTWPTS